MAALSDASAHALRAKAQRLVAELEVSGDELAPVILRALNDDKRAPYRLALVAKSREELTRALEQEVARIGEARPRFTVPRIAFLFAGQGTQYEGMAHALYHACAVFRHTFDEVAELLSHEGGADVRPYVRDALDDARIHDTVITQPLLFAFGVALAETWKSLGVHADVVCGHSLGEVVAACIAGVLSKRDAAHLVVARARALSSIPTPSSMATVFASAQLVREELVRMKSTVEIAAINSAQNVVIAGEDKALDHALFAFAQRKVEATKLRISFGAHSSAIEPTLDTFEKAIESLSYAPPSLVFVSNVSGAKHTAALSASYFRTHARKPVQFERSMRTLVDEHVECFLAIEPHTTVLRLARATIARGTFLPSMERGGDDLEHMLRAGVELYRRGAAVDLASLYAMGSSRTR